MNLRQSSMNSDHPSDYDSNYDAPCFMDRVSIVPFITAAHLLQPAACRPHCRS